MDSNWKKEESEAKNHLAENCTDLQELGFSWSIKSRGQSTLVAACDCGLMFQLEQPELAVVLSQNVHLIQFTWTKTDN